MIFQKRYTDNQVLTLEMEVKGCSHDKDEVSAMRIPLTVMRYTK